MTGTRLEALRQSMRSGRVDALLITHLPHVRYLTGFTGSNAACLVTGSSVWLGTDPRYATQVKAEVREARVLVGHGALAPQVIRSARVGKHATIAVDKSRTTISTFEQVRSVRPAARWRGVDGTLDELFSVKSDDEVRAIRSAAAITDDVFAGIVEWIRPGMRESEVAAEISYRQRLMGAEKDSFETIVASGVRGALPHARASRKRIRKGELVTLDFGCVIDGYCSDLTRTIAIGRVSPRLRRMYESVLAAQLSSLALIRAGIGGRQADAEARRVLKERRLSQWFRHSLGHGLGLDVHEHPRLAPRSGDMLEEGQVITVEPGVYIPGVGGVRIEDDVVVTATGVELLTRSPKGLIIV